MESGTSNDTGSFILSHPEEQPNLTKKIEGGSAPSHYINRYHADHDVACAFCAKQTPHRRGYTAQMPDGRIALIGRDCASEFFGKERASSWEKALKAQEDRRARRRVVERAVASVPSLLVQITPELVSIERQCLDITCAITEGMAGRQPQVLRRDNGDWDIVADDRRVLYTVAAAAILNAGRTRRHHLAKALEALKKLSAIDATTDMSDKVVSRMLDLRTSLIADIESGLRLLRRCARFYTANNLKALSRVLASIDSGITRVDLKVKSSGTFVRLTDRGIRIEGFDGGYLREAEHATFPLPNLNELPSSEQILALIK